MKRSILLSLMVIGAVAALITAATSATFTDQVTSTGNTFATGTMFLSVDGNCGTPTRTAGSGGAGGGSACEAGHHTVTVTSDGFKPGDTKTQTFPVTNQGTVDGKLTVTAAAHAATYPATCDSTNWEITTTPAAGTALGHGASLVSPASVSVKLVSGAGNGCQNVTLTVDVTFDLAQA